MPGCGVWGGFSGVLDSLGPPDGLSEKALRLAVAWSQNPSEWRSHRRHGVLSLLRNPDTFSDKARDVATAIAEKGRELSQRRGYAYCGNGEGTAAERR